QGEGSNGRHFVNRALTRAPAARGARPSPGGRGLGGPLEQPRRERQVMNLKRLREMDSNEIAHRLREQIRRETDKMKFRAGSALDDDAELDSLISSHGSSLKSYFRYGPARRFYPSTQDREGITNIILRNGDWVDRAIEEAGRLCAHRLNLFNHRN